MNPQFRRDPAHANDAVSTDLTELVGLVAKLPAQYRRELDLAISKVTQSTRRRRKILNLVQEALSQLRLDMKYLMFDLEATRRERDQFRDQLKELRGEDD